MRVALAALALLATPATAQSLDQRVRDIFREAGPGPRFGLVVTTDTGEEIVAIAPDDRFVPASNTKLFTTAAAFATWPGVNDADSTGGASVRLERGGRGAPGMVLTGHGDARLSSAADCKTDCLADLADAVAEKTRTVGDVTGDDSLFPDERWSQGMSWNNIQTRSGTATSALTLDDNELALTVSPGARAGDPPSVSGLPYYSLDNRIWTVTAGKTDVGYDRLPGSDRVRLTGTIALGAAPERLRLGIDDPAHYAAWRLRAMLVERGVRVTGQVRVRHRPLSAADDPARRGTVERTPEPAWLARLIPAPLAEDLKHINKVSQNLHAELALRRIGLITGTGSVADGLAQVTAMLASAGVPRTAYDFSDGSGMSTYNRVSPRGAVTFLRWTQTQPWGAQWRDTLPGAGEGTLARRFAGTSLAGRVFAKTGTLNATTALSGFLTAASGRTLIFASYVNDIPGDASASAIVDKALQAVAAAN